MQNHKAFLFNREKQLLVIPVTLAEIKNKETASANTYGEFTFQGAYVYNLNLKDGFELKGRISHIDDEQVYLKSGYYFGSENAIRRSLYIGNVLYTLSDGRIQANSLSDLAKINALDLREVKADETKADEI